MGSKDWLRTIITMKKIRSSKSNNSKDLITEESNGTQSHESDENVKDQSEPEKSEEIPDKSDGAAVRIQTAFRCYQARETLQLLRTERRLKAFALGDPVKERTSCAVNYVQSWNKIQSAISSRRHSVGIEGRLREKKPGAKLRSPELVEWRGGRGTREDFLARTRQKEEAVAKRERAMAYTFALQGRANPGARLGQLGNEQGEDHWSWNWSWTDRRAVAPEKTSPAKTARKAHRRTASASAKSAATVVTPV